ncbi:NUDIX hydrolase [Paenibacillus durus]|uniref:Phosphohydrolase n=1 Tax=Paenibacillus durus TaxID=44251 RepID=A0A089HT78_PAEDU|nr:NUDIX hydrolase [Paenibacillus durus]AIQ14297.1 phosphohydrolase [Paenibacillus durus]
MNRVDVAYSLITKENKTKILMVKNKDNNSWTLPGGAVEKGETLKQAAIREVKEETGYEVNVFGIVAVNECIFEDRQEHAVFFTFNGEITNGHERIERPEEITEIAWKDINEAEQLMPYYEEGIRILINKNIEIPYTDQGRR